MAKGWKGDVFLIRFVWKGGDRFFRNLVATFVNINVFFVKLEFGI